MVKGEGLMLNGSRSSLVGAVNSWLAVGPFKDIGPLWPLQVFGTSMSKQAAGAI